MKVFLVFTIVSLLAIAPVSAPSVDAQENLEQAARNCAQIKKKSKRLKCYDALFRDADDTDDAGDDDDHNLARKAPQAAVDAAPGKKEPSREDAFGAPKQKEQKDEKLKSIKTTLDSFTVYRSGKARLRLANGQIWDTKEEIPSYLLKIGTAVEIKRGALKSYRAIFKGSKASFGVRRYVRKK